MSEINKFTNTILRSVVAQIFKAIGWQSSSSVCIQVLVDMLHLYLKDLCFSLRDCADANGRQTPSMHDVSMLVKLKKIDLDDLVEYMDYVDPIELGFTVPKYPIAKELSLNILKPGSAEVLIRPAHIHEHLPPMFPELEDVTIKSEENSNIGDLLSNDPLTSKIQSLGDKESKEREILQKCKKYNISREEGRPERILTSIAMTTSGFLTSSREGRVADSRLPPEFARDDSPEISTEQRKRRKSFDKKSTDCQKHSKKKEESKKRLKSHNEGSRTRLFTGEGGIASTEHGSSYVDHKKIQMHEKYKKGTDFVPSIEEKAHSGSHKHKHKHKKMSKVKINDFSGSQDHNGIGKIDNSFGKVTKHSHQIVGELVTKDKKNLKRTYDQCIADAESESSNNSSLKVSKRGRKKRKLSTDNIYPDKTEGKSEKSFTSTESTHLLKYPSTPLVPGLIPSIGQNSFERFSSSLMTDVRGKLPAHNDTAVAIEVSIENEEHAFEDAVYEEKEELNIGEEKKKSKREHKKKKDKKEKNKKKDKKDKNKDKSEKKKDKCKKHKKSHYFNEDVDQSNDNEQQVAVPKFKLKLGKKSSQVEDTSMSTADEPISTPQVMNLPETDIKPIKIKTPKIRNMEPTTPQSATPITIGQSAFMALKSETSTPAILQPPVQKRGRGRPRKSETVIPKAPKRPAAFYYDVEGNQVWVCPLCGVQDDGSPMIGCDGCDAWYHWACIDMTSAPVSKKWFCPVCAKS